MSDRAKHKVVGVGQCAYDIVGALNIYPQVDQKIELSELTLQGGGPVATALVTLSRLGVETAICSRIGDDFFGKSIRAGLIAENIDCSALSTDPGRTSQLAFIAVDAFGKHTVFWHRGNANPLTAQEIDVELISGADILHLDGLHFAAAYAAAEIARRCNVVTVLDGGTLRERTLELLPLIDHLVVSEKFARQFSGDVELEKMLDRLLDYGGVAATVTCGERGSWTKANGGDLFHQPAFRVHVVDTTGCGDVFHGGYIYGLLQGMPIKETVRFAAASAALKARSTGGRTGIPTLSDIDILLSSEKFI